MNIIAGRAPPERSEERGGDFPRTPNHVAETLTDTRPETLVNDMVTVGVKPTRNRTHGNTAIQEGPGRFQEGYQEANNFNKGREPE